jgi:membrane protein YqaA with SNARE-associated domain
VQGVLNHAFGWLLGLGSGGLFILGVLDSSFLMLPLGNDLLITALTIRHHERLPFYIAFASLGSCTGVFLLDLVTRKGGEVGLQKIMSKRRFEYLKRKMSRRASIPLALVCVAPPPFPFTPVVATASAFNYPRWRLLAIILVGRIVRFTVVGLLAIHFGDEILRLAKTNVFVGVMIAIIAASAIGSVLSVMKWVRQSRRRAAD